MSAGTCRLYHRLQLAAHRLQKIADREVIKASGLTTAQAGVLSVVANGENITQRDVATQLGLNESAVTAMVNRLINMGLVERVRCIEDRRAWQLDLTDHGTSTLGKTKEPFQALNEAIDKELPEKEVEQLVKGLNRLINVFES